MACVRSFPACMLYDAQWEPASATRLPGSAFTVTFIAWVSACCSMDTPRPFLVRASTGKVKASATRSPSLPAEKTATVASPASSGVRGRGKVLRDAWGRGRGGRRE